MAHLVLILTTLASALIAGLFYAYACSVVPGLGRLPNAEYLAAMQSINSTILNPVFFASFMGTLLLLPLCTYLQYSTSHPRFLFLLAASLVYAIGVFGVTAVVNVPLNEALSQFDLSSASPEALAAQRLAFEGRWNQWNTVRTVASILSLVLVILACLKHSTTEAAQ